MSFRIKRAERVGKQDFGRHDIEGPLRLAAAHGRAADQWSAALTGIAQEYADYKEQEYDDQEVDADLEAITGIGELEADNAGKDEFDASTLDESHPSYNQGTSGDAPVMVPGYTARPDTYRIGAKQIAEQASKRIQDPSRQKAFMSRYLKTIEGKYAVKKLNGLKEAKAYHDRKLIAQIDQAESNDKFVVSAELIKQLPEDLRIEYAERNADRSADSVIAKARLAEDVASLKQIKEGLTDKDYNGPLSAKVRQIKAKQVQGDIDYIVDRHKAERVAGEGQEAFDRIDSAGGSYTQKRAKARTQLKSKPLVRDDVMRRLDKEQVRSERAIEEGKDSATTRAYAGILKDPTSLAFMANPNIPAKQKPVLLEFRASALAGVPVKTDKVFHRKLVAMRAMDPEAFANYKLYLELGKLSEGDQKSFVASQEKIRKELAAAATPAKQTSVQSVKGVIEGALKAKGWDLSAKGMAAKGGPEVQDHYNRIVGQVEAEIEALEKAKGRQLGPKERNDVARAVVKEAARYGDIDDPDAAWYWPTATVTGRKRKGFADVPQAYVSASWKAWKKAADTARAEGKSPPAPLTAATILRRWQAKGK